MSTTIKVNNNKGSKEEWFNKNICNINAYQQFQPRCKLMPDAGVPLGKGFERHGVGWLVEVKRQTLKKALVLIVLVLVFPHQITIKKYRFVYIQQSK